MGREPSFMHALAAVTKSLRAPAALLACLACCTSAWAAGAPRVETPLMEGWRFHAGHALGEPEDPAFDDAQWEAVALPHTWNALGEYRVGRTAATRNRQGIGWYRLTFDSSKLPNRQRHLLQFDAVGTVADVWVNGRHAGSHAGGFSRFRFDVTTLLRNGRNVVAVRADNSEPAPGSATEHVIPLKGDFFPHGGLYRPVSLVSVDDLHIALDDHGGPGVYVHTVSMSPQEAELKVLARLGNLGDPAEATLRLRLQDGNGQVVAESVETLQAGRGRSTSTQRLKVPSPRLWNGRQDPHLYQLIVTLERDGKAVDQVEQPVGIRSVRIDPERGFFLNGRHLPLRGVSRHQDWLGRGWALTAEDHARDMALIEEMGANSIRFAHYQHAEDWFRLSAERGMVVWAELGFVNRVSNGNVPASAALRENAREQLVEQIRQHYNNPAVAVWGIGNEVDIEMALRTDKSGPLADPLPLLRELQRVARHEDPHRPTVIADCCEDTPGDKPGGLQVLAGISDLMGYNRYYGWYYGKVDDLGPHLDALHARHPEVPISVSEYGVGAALTQHADDPQGGLIGPGSRWHPEGFQAWYHERTWPQIAARPYLWGSWIWNMFDFSSTVRQEGDASDINDKGLVTFDRRVRKDAFHYYKAQWSDQPVLHVNGRRYVDRAYPVTDVRVYSNAERVSLQVNDMPAGDVACEGRVCVFPGVRLKAGANRVVASADFEGTTLTDTVEWNAPDTDDGMAINAGDLAGATVGERRFGSDAFFEGGEARRIGDDLSSVLRPGVDSLLLGYREGEFSYQLPLPPGRWLVSFLTYQPAPAQRSQTFDVIANGRVVRKEVPPGDLSDGQWLPRYRTFGVDVGNEGLRLEFKRHAVVSAINILSLDRRDPKKIETAQSRSNGD